MKSLTRKHLVIFDFDNTLCQTNGLIYANDKYKEQHLNLTPPEYVDFRKSDLFTKDISRWSFDFSEFTGYPEKGSPIDEVFDMLRTYLHDEKYIVALVTGRDELSGPTKFLYSMGISPGQIKFLCSGDPDKKPCYESLLTTYYPSNVIIYEDCIVHIQQCEEVCAKYSIPCSGILIENKKINWQWRSENFRRIYDAS